MSQQDSDHLAAIDDLRKQIKALRHGQPAVPHTSYQHPVVINQHPDLITQSRQPETLQYTQHFDVDAQSQQQTEGLSRHQLTDQGQAYNAFNFGGGWYTLRTHNIKCHFNVFNYLFCTISLWCFTDSQLKLLVEHIEK